MDPRPGRRAGPPGPAECGQRPADVPRGRGRHGDPRPGSWGRAAGHLQKSPGAEPATGRPATAALASTSVSQHFGQPAQSDAVGTRTGPEPSACRTIAVTAGLVGSWEWLTCTPGQTDWMGTLIAPASRAESGGVTVVSPVLHSDSQRGRAGPAVASSRVSSLLSGPSCRHAAGHAPGTNASAAEASSVPWNGEPRVITRRALCAPPSCLAHSRVVTPPAEYPTTSTDGAPPRSARLTAAFSTPAS